MNQQLINPEENLKFTCIKNHSLSIKSTEYNGKFYVISKALNGIKIDTIHSNEEDAYQKIVSYLLGYTLHKIEKMNITQLKEMVEYLLLI